MRIKKLRLKGFAGIHSGQGRNEIDIDFERVVGDAQLVAITGPNGSGKTTIMDNLTPYRLMPSKTEKPTPSGFSYYDHMSAPTALKELEWEHEGQRYRTSITLKTSGRTREQKAYLHVWQDGGWKPVKLDGLESDGKTDTYDECIVRLLGEPEVFFASQFSAQGKRSLASYTNGEIKTLMSGMLNLDSIRSMGARANQVAKLLRAGLDALRTTLGALAAREAALPGLETDAAIAGENTTQSVAHLRSAKTVLAQAQEALIAAKAEAAAAADTEALRAGLETQIRKGQARLDAAVATVNNDLADAQNRWQRIHEQLAEEERQTAQQQTHIEAEGKKQKALIDRRDEIMTAGQKVERLRTEAAQMETAAKAEAALMEQIVEMRNRKTVLQGGIQSLTRERTGQCRHRDMLVQQAGLVQQVPCRGSDLQEVCPLLREAVQAGRSLDNVEMGLSDLERQHTERSEELNQVAADLSALEAEVAETNAKTRLADITTEIHRLEKVAGLAPALEVATSALQAARAQWRSLAEASTSRQQSLNLGIAETEQTLAGLKARKTAMEASWHEQETALRSQIATLPASKGADAVSVAQSAMATAEAGIAKCEAAVDAARNAESAKQAALEAARAEIAAGAATKSHAARIEAEISHWGILAKALGNDGVIALSIDDAGPELARLANDLLLSCYGARFTIAIQTQVQTAKGETKEGFEIMVHDANNGTSKPIGMMSGGEQVWINESVTRAIALYVARTSGRRYQTLFSDEADGALDPDRKRQFMAMKRRVLELGGYEQEFFVSQTPELWGMADAVIDLAKVAEALDAAA